MNHVKTKRQAIAIQRLCQDGFSPGSQIIANPKDPLFYIDKETATEAQILIRAGILEPDPRCPGAHRLPDDIQERYMEYVRAHPNIDLSDPR